MSSYMITHGDWAGRWEGKLPVNVPQFVVPFFLFFFVDSKSRGWCGL